MGRKGLGVMGVGTMGKGCMRVGEGRLLSNLMQMAGGAVTMHH